MDRLFAPPPVGAVHAVGEMLPDGCFAYARITVQRVHWQVTSPRGAAWRSSDAVPTWLRSAPTVVAAGRFRELAALHTPTRKEVVHLGTAGV